MRTQSSPRGPTHPLVCLLVRRIVNPYNAFSHAHTHEHANMFCQHTRTHHNACTGEQKYRCIRVTKSHEDVDQDISTGLSDVCK